MRNEPDSGPDAEGAVVTYSRLSTRGRRDVEQGRTTAERQEPVLEAREVPYETDLRAFDPERAGDDVAKPKRNRKRRGGFAAVLLGTLALAIGMVILAYAYGVATRVDAPAAASASAPAPASENAGSVRAILPADDAARSVAAPGTVPAAEAPAETAQPPAATDQASTPVPDGADGTPMDGDFALPAGDGAQPDGQTAKPSQPATGDAAPATEPANPAPSKAASAPPADSQPATASKPAAVASKPAADKPATAASAGGNPPADSTDSLITNIEKLLNDGTTAEGAGQPSGNGGPTSMMTSDPTPLMSGQPTAVADPNALPQLPDPTGTSAQRSNRLIPPADIPNVSPTDSGSGLQ